MTICSAKYNLAYNQKAKLEYGFTKYVTWTFVVVTGETAALVTTDSALWRKLLHLSTGRGGYRELVQKLAIYQLEMEEQGSGAAGKEELNAGKERSKTKGYAAGSGREEKDE